MAEVATPESPVDIASIAGRFAERLHRFGVAVGPDRAGRFASAVGLARPATTHELYWIGRVTLVSDATEIASYDRVFADVFRGLVDTADSRGDTNQPNLDDLSAGERLPDRRDSDNSIPGKQARPVPQSDQSETADDSAEQIETPIGAPASHDELLRHRDFADCTIAELAELRALIRRLQVSTPIRPSRRRRPHRAGKSIDHRATLRQARRTGGHPVHLAHRRVTTRQRRVVLIADVSGSMEAYSRAYLYVLHGAVKALRAETFVFATGLTRLTRSLRLGDPERALRAAVAETTDWSGGTRIGAAIKEFNDGWGRRGLARGSVIVIVSDGWEGQDPAVLGEQMARLSRLAHRIIWVNPRSKSSRYQPLAGGMAAALPYVDVFTSGHSISALDEVLAAIASS